MSITCPNADPKENETSVIVCYFPRDRQKTTRYS
jgi:hypothetical protein